VGEVQTQLPIEFWLPGLRDMVREWAPAAAWELLAHVRSTAETAAAAVQSVAVPAWQALRALGVPEVPEADLPFASLATDIGQGLLDAAQDVSAELVKRALSGFEGSAAPPARPEGPAEQDAPDAGMRQDTPGDGRQGGEQGVEGDVAAPAEQDRGVEASRPPAAGLFDGPDRGAALAGLLAGAVFASGLYARPSARPRYWQRQARSPGPEGERPA
jgi:hypothetical protein